MFFSILIIYRERDPQTLARCLESLQQQHYKDFEIIFVNYGSQAIYTQKIKKLLEVYPSIKYIYSETQGKLWSRSIALNLAIAQAQGEYIITVDIDFIFAPSFLASVQKICSPEVAIRYIIYYLPADFKDFKNLAEKAENLCAHLEKAAEDAMGAMIAHRVEAFLKVNGYDEKYQIWGREDMDIVEKFKKLGLKLLDFDAPNNRVFHQWHPKGRLPQAWPAVIERYFQSRRQRPLSVGQFSPSQSLKVSERPALQLWLHQDLNTDDQIYFEFPKSEAWTILFKKFYELSRGDYFYIHQDFSVLPIEQSSRAGNFMKKMNQFLKKLGLSYRFTTIHYHETDVWEADEVYDFLVYFIWHFESQFSDYYLARQEDKIHFVLVK